MNKTTHTPLPAEISVGSDGLTLRVPGKQGFRGEDYRVANAYFSNTLANCPGHAEAQAFALALKTRYNSHDRLVEALKTTLETLDRLSGEVAAKSSAFYINNAQAEAVLNLRNSRALLAELEGGA